MRAGSMLQDTGGYVAYRSCTALSAYGAGKRGILWGSYPVLQLGLSRLWLEASTGPLPLLLEAWGILRSAASLPQRLPRRTARDLRDPEGAPGAPDSAPSAPRPAVAANAKGAAADVTAAPSAGAVGGGGQSVSCRLRSTGARRVAPPRRQRSGGRAMSRLSPQEENLQGKGWRALPGEAGPGGGAGCGRGGVRPPSLGACRPARLRATLSSGAARRWGGRSGRRRLGPVWRPGAEARPGGTSAAAAGARALRGGRVSPGGPAPASARALCGGRNRGAASCSP